MKPVNGRELWKSSHCRNPTLTLFRWLLVAEKAGTVALSSDLPVMCDAVVLTLTFLGFEW